MCCFTFRSVLTAFLLLWLQPGSAQLLTLNNITVTNTSSVTVQGDVTGTAGAAITNNGTFSFTGHLTNNSGNFLFGNGTGTVVLNGGNQDIGGSSVTRFNHLTLLGAGNKRLLQDVQSGGSSGTGVFSLGTQRLDLNSRLLTVLNPSPVAITRTTGFIVSETGPAPGYGNIRWHIGVGTGNYIFPFGNALSGHYLPVTLEVTVPGTGPGGSIQLATYPTTTSATPNNRPLPTGLTSLLSFSGAENAANVMDRWWLFNVSGYTVAPVSTVTFAYRESEWDATGGSTNTIMENSLQAQSGTGALWSPVPSGTVNTVSNTVTVSGVNLYHPIWTLVGSSSPLPVELLAFNAALNRDGQTDLDWITATEINNDYFTVERSRDGLTFDPMFQVDGTGNSSSTQYYHAVDPEPFPGITYYRLKQTDYDGHYAYSEIRAVKKELSPATTFTIFPNPARELFYLKFDAGMYTAPISIYDLNGKLVREFTGVSLENSGTGVIKLERGGLQAGIYFIAAGDGRMEKLVLL